VIAVPYALSLYGWAGVDLFFALSGFLITGILIETRRASGALQRFFIRRALRIWPLYLLTVGALTTVAFCWPALSPQDAQSFQRAAPWYWFHAVNLMYQYGHVSKDPFAFGPVFGSGAIWSLSVEEQFYLVWPFAVWLLDSRWLARACLLVVITSVAIRVWSVASGLPSGFAYLVRWDAIAMGAALAIAARKEPGLWTSAKRAMSPVLEGSVARWLILLLASWTLLRGLAEADARGLHTFELLGLPVVAALGALAVFSAVAAPAGAPIARLLTSRPLREVGRVSYGLYVAHVIVLRVTDVLFQRYWPGAPRGLIALLAYVVAGCVALASWRYWERPWLRLKRFVPLQSRVDQLPKHPRTPRLVS
jgi:peptidoglycan/LPS O-acetylase OafA/YrhL